MLTIPAAEPQTFDFVLDGEEQVYSLPLARQLPLAMLQSFAAIAGMADGDEKNAAAITAQLDILRQYMGERADALTGEQVQAIFDAWNAASGDELGE